MSDPVELIQAGRIADDLWRLVNIPSPTGHERDVAMAFAEMLSAAGAVVEIDSTLPQSPSVIGRLTGSRPGQVFQLAGHLDHIDVPHSPPKRDDTSITARGAADMKNGLAGILEVVRVLGAAGRDFAGEVLVTAYGLHEAPAGDSAGLLSLIRRGVVGDAALVAECPTAGREIVVAGMGQSIWSITLVRAGQACHELRRQPKDDALLALATTLAARLQSHSADLASRASAYPLLPAESLFVGQLHYGDFYNRCPARCTLQGTRRWHPCRRFDDVRRELDELIAKVDRPANVEVRIDWTFVGESYQMNESEPVVRALRESQRSITGVAPGIGGMSAICDSNRLVPLASVPTVLVGFDNEFAHADVETVRLDRLGEAARIVLRTVLNYLNDADKRP